MPRPKAYDATEVLERAMRAFWAHGYEGTSMSDLVDATGINRGSLYTAYADKHALFMESLRYFDQVYRADFLNSIAQHHAGKDAIVAAFEGVCALSEEGETPGGCLLVNTALELSPHDSEVRNFIDGCLSEVEGFFYEQLESAKHHHAMDRSTPSRQTAQAILALFLGLRVLTRTGPNKPAAAAIVAQVKAMLA